MEDKEKDKSHPCHGVGLDFARCVTWTHQDLIREQVKRIHPISGHQSSLMPLGKDRPANGHGEDY